MAIEKTLVLLKPCTLQRSLVGEIISVFENIENDEYDFAIEDTPVTDSVEGIEEHYINFRVKFRRITIND